MTDEDYKLPCDVKLPPATTIGAGCSLSTLKLAMELSERPRHFAGAAQLPGVDRLRELGVGTVADSDGDDGA